MPVEIKIAESWSLTDLEDALKKQLCGRYLRQRENKHGILLLVHQKPRKDGWKKSDGTKLNFAAVVAHLKEMAIVISGSSSDAPQPEIAVLDVASFNTGNKATKKVRKKRETQKKTTKAKRTSATTLRRKRKPKGKK